MTQRFCKDCIHYHDDSHFSCWLPLKQLDLVTGDTLYSKDSASVRRSRVLDSCGPEGKMWEQIPLEDKMPRKAPESLVQRLHKVFGTWVAKLTDSRVRASMTLETLMEFFMVVLSHGILFLLTFIVFVANPPMVLYVFFLLIFIVALVLNMVTSYMFLEGFKK